MTYTKVRPGNGHFDHLTPRQRSYIRKALFSKVMSPDAFHKEVGRQARHYGVHRRYILRALQPLQSPPVQEIELGTIELSVTPLSV